MSVSTRDVERQVLGEVWTSDAIYRNLIHLCDDLGHRFGGSDSEHAAARFLKQKMDEYGLKNTRLEEFPMYGWERGDCFFAVTAPLERSFSAIAMPYCGSADLEGELVDVGEGEAADFARLGDAVRGKIALTDAETNRPGETKSHRTDKYRRAVEAGATGCVFINQNPGLLHITGALYGKNPSGSEASDHEAPIPGIGISYEAGAALRRFAERGPVHARIRTTNRTFRSHSYNVVGDIPGGTHPEEIVLMGGHYDGHDVAQGAGDDAAGTLVGLEVGRVLAPFAGQLARTVRIICFGCEEIGLLGAWHHAERYRDTGEVLRVAVNLDGAGRGQGGQEQITVTGDPNLVPYFARFADEHLYAVGIRDQVGPHSDHFPFFLQGYPSATLNSRDSTAGMIGRGYGHTEADTVDKVTLRGLQMGAAIAARLAATLANDDEFPGRRRSRDEVVAVLERGKMTDLLEHHWGRDNRAE
ncbi:MAG TPA: M28 family peptidase [Thermomicrobiaceae bacterium]|nr:M28 family peptidase [Thermomicrobiaceae bacterium]